LLDAGRTGCTGSEKLATALTPPEKAAREVRQVGVEDSDHQSSCLPLACTLARPRKPKPALCSKVHAHGLILVKLCSPYGVSQALAQQALLSTLRVLRRHP
jgi:hypothetical protein